MRTQWAVMPQLPQRQQRVRSKVLPFQDKRSGWSTIAGNEQRTWCGNHVQAISLDERAPRPIVSPVVCSWSFRCAACLPLLSFFLFLLVRSARISCLSRTARGGVSQGAIWPNAVDLQYALRPVAPWERALTGQPPAIGLDTTPRPLRLMIWACLDRPWSLLPAEPRVRPLVGHFRLAPKGT